VVELVDDDDVEVIGLEVCEARSMERLDRGKHVVEGPGLLVRHPHLAERRVAQRVPERGQALLEDLAPVRDEQESRARKAPLQARVVDGRHDGLARSGGGDEQVLVVALLAREGDLFEQSFLERLGAQLEGAEP
jgi:hypothetical protein